MTELIEEEELFGYNRRKKEKKLYKENPTIMSQHSYNLLCALRLGTACFCHTSVSQKTKPQELETHKKGQEMMQKYRTWLHQAQQIDGLPPLIQPNTSLRTTLKQRAST